MNESYRLRYTNQIVGVFLLTLLVSILTLGIVVTSYSRIFVKPDRFTVMLTEEMAGDLRTDTEVIVLGKRIGKVEKIDYVETGDKVRVTLAIDPLFSDQITTDSELTLERKFGIGMPVVRIRRKSDGDSPTKSIPIPPGEEIKRFKGEVDRVEQMANEVQGARGSIGKIQEDLHPTLSSLGNASKRFSQSLEKSIDPAFDGSKSAFQSVEETSEKIRPEAIETLALIRSATEEIKNNLETTLGSIEQSADAATTAARSVTNTTTNIDKKSDKTNEDIIETLKTMREAVTSIQKLSNEIRDMVKVLRGEANELPGTTQQAKDTMVDTQSLVDEVRGHWLLRGTNRAPAPSQQVSPSSLRVGGAR